MPSTAPSHNLVRHLAQFLDRHAVPAGEPLLVGFSGGADSTALLAGTVEVGQERGNEIHAAYFDHALREPSERRAEAEHVTAFTEALGVPLHHDGLRPGSLRSRSDRSGRSLEAEAREARFRFFVRVLESVRSGYLLLAHHADDQAETILMRVLSGSGIVGMAGMDEIRPISQGEKRCVLRPLLAISRDTVREYLDQSGVPYVEDSSNRSMQHVRNRLRHEVLPLLERLLPQARTGLLASGSKAREARDYLRARAARLLDRETSREGVAFPRGEFFAESPVVRRSALYAAVERLGLERSAIPSRFLRPALGAEPAARKMTLARGYGIRIEVRPGSLLCRRDVVYPPENGYLYVVPVSGDREHNQRVRVTASLGRDARSAERTVILESRDLRLPLLVRSRRQGDVLHLPGGQKAVGRLLSELHMPKASRNSIPVLEDRAGVVGLILSPWGLPDRFREGVRWTDSPGQTADIHTTLDIGSGNLNDNAELHVNMDEDLGTNE